MSYFTPEERYCASVDVSQPQRKKGALADAHGQSKIVSGCLRLFGTLLLDFLDLVDQIFCLL